MRALLTILATIVLASLPAAAQTGEALAGTWDNADPETRSIKRLVIEEGPGGLVVRAFGSCGGELCDLGPAGESAALGADPGDLDADAFLVRWDFGFSVLTFTGVRADLFAERDPGARLPAAADCPLVVAEQAVFNDGSGRSSFLVVERFCAAGGASPGQDAVVGPERWLDRLRGLTTN